MEKWKNIENLDGYMISDYGRVKSFKRKNYIILSQRKIKSGYMQVHFSIKGKEIRKLISRLVLETFKPVENMENLEVNHKDGNKENNKLYNLEWMTHSDNIKHAYKNGLLKKMRGEKNPSSKLKEEDIKLILLSDNNLTYKEIGKIFGVSGDTISLIKRRKIWTHIGDD